LGRSLIELVRAIDKEGLAPTEPFFSENVKRIRPKAMD
jgi:hypothetical protein